MSEQVSNLEAEVIRDLKQDFQGDHHENMGPGVENSPPADFLPRELVRLLVVGKNGLTFAYLTKDISETAAVVVKQAYTPSDAEIDLYRINLQKYIRTSLPQVADWFQRNTNVALAELMAFEIARLTTVATVLKEGRRQKEKESEKKTEVENG